MRDRNVRESRTEYRCSILRLRVEPETEIEETASAGGSSLTYGAARDQYTYIWKTSKAWKGACRMLVIRFIDGTDHYAKFRFK